MNLIADGHTPTFGVLTVTDEYASDADRAELPFSFGLGNGQTGMATKNSQVRKVWHMIGKRHLYRGQGAPGGGNPILDICFCVHGVWPELLLTIALEEESTCTLNFVSVGTLCSAVLLGCVHSAVLAVDALALAPHGKGTLEFCAVV